ncbi:MAG: universal stress protein [Terriglobales bacterium]
MSQAAGPQKISGDALPVFTRILLVTDFSACSEAAVPFARLLSECYSGSITVAHVMLADQDTSSNEAVVGTMDEVAELADLQMRRFLRGNSLVDTESVITTGPLGDAVARLVQQEGFDIVVVGTHGRSGVGKLLLGSAAQRIFNVSPCPVLSVSTKARKSWGVQRKLRKVLYATDLSEFALEALPYALSLAKATDAELLLVNVPNPSEPIRQHGAINKKLAELLPPAARSWCHFETLVGLVHGEGEDSIVDDPAAVIVRVAIEYAADLIVIGAKRVAPGLLYRINVPLSTAYQVLAHAPCPVLRVRS